MRRIDGKIIITAEEVIGKFKLNYNRAISEYEATRHHSDLRSSASFGQIREATTDEDFNILIKDVKWYAKHK